MPKFTTIPGMVARNLAGMKELIQLLRDLLNDPSTTPSRMALVRELIEAIDAEIAGDERGLAVRMARLSNQ
jgi:hypothetical protein